MIGENDQVDFAKIGLEGEFGGGTGGFGMSDQGIGIAPVDHADDFYH